MLIFTNRVYSQTLEKIKQDYDSTITCDSKTTPLTPSAFDRFIVDLYSFTIVGSQSPTTGLKFETTTPSITLKGNVIQNKYKSFITTLELTTGADNTFMQIFSDNKLNSFIKVGVGFNFLPAWGSATYITQNSKNTEKFNQLILCHLRQNAIKKYFNLYESSFKSEVIGLLFDAKFYETPTFKFIKEEFENSQHSKIIKVEYQEAEKKAKIAQKKLSKVKSVSKTISLNETILKSSKVTNPDEIPAKLESTIKEILKDFKINNNETDQIDSLLKDFACYWRPEQGNVKMTEKEALLNKYRKLSILQKGAVDSLFKYEIQAVDALWTTKRIHWFNVSPFFENSNFTLYESVKKTMIDSNSTLWGTKFSYNYLKKFKEPHRYFFLTLGVSPQKVNTVSELEKYIYKETIQIKETDPAVPTDTKSLTKEEAGIGYEGFYDTGFGADVFSEFYYVPWKPAGIPGFYGKLQYSYGDPWINKNKVALALGLVWNVTSSEKESKNLLTIVPMVRWSNLRKNYTHRDKIGVSALHDLFTAGIQVGIPINLGK